MRIVDYKQTTDKSEAVNFINSLQEGSVIEITAHNKNIDTALYRAMEVYADDECIYKITPAKNYFWNATKGEFYLSAREGWGLYKFFECMAEGSVVPHWWPYAERNIRRHGDPLLDLREASLHGCTITVKFVE